MSVRVVLIDSGVNVTHPHIRELGEVHAAYAVDGSGVLVQGAEQADALGHGTAAAAAILDLAPGTELHSIQVFRDQPVCPFEVVIQALERAIDLEPQLINLSLGTTQQAWRAELEAPIARAVGAGVTILSPAAHGGLPSLPGCLVGVTGVLMDAGLERNAPELRESGSTELWYASPHPRELPNLPQTANLAGVSMACANLTGHLASQASATA